MTNNFSAITPALLNAVYEQPWNITGGAWRSIHAAISGPQQINLADFFIQRDSIQQDDNGIAHIHVKGILGNQPPIAGVFGDTDYGVLTREIQMAGASADGIMLHVDSPGGQASGNVEVSEALTDSPVPVVAFCDGMACSAAYFIASGADHIEASPSAMVGSIGTIIPFIDSRKAWEDVGIKADYITNDGADLKGAGMPPGLNEEQRAHMKEIVNDYAAQFKGHVTKYRAISEDTMRGQAFVAPRAVDRNLIDNTGSLESAYSHLLELVGNS